MLWFTKDKRARMTHRYKERALYVDLLQRDLALPAQVRDNTLLARRGFDAADADPHEFATLFGEPMPEHLRIAVHLETDLWVAIHTTLDGARNAKLAPQEYQRLVPNLRRELETLQKLLALQAEIMYSPLSKHFTEQLTLLRAVRA